MQLVAAQLTTSNLGLHLKQARCAEPVIVHGSTSQEVQPLHSSPLVSRYRRSLPARVHRRLLTLALVFGVDRSLIPGYNGHLGPHTVHPRRFS